LDPILELKIQSCFPVAVLLSQDRDRLARIVIAVMKEKDDFAADLFLKSASCLNLSDQESLWKKSARLLAETNNRLMHRSEEPSYPSGSSSVAKDSLLQQRRQAQHGGAPNKIVPEVTDIGRGEEDEHERLSDERGEKYRRTCNAPNKECR
jgi:hypothetical protein